MKKIPEDYLFLKTDSFYSRVLHSCIFSQLSEPDASGTFVEHRIQDLSHGLLRGPLWNTLLYCDKDGADSVIVDKVRQYDGYVDDVRHTEWQDDGFGGPSRAEKTPSHRYTARIGSASSRSGWIT